MISLGAAIAALEQVPEQAGGGWRGEVPDNWLQGRTAYGGFSTALALAVAQRSDEELPPLRSAQVAFIGPLAGAVTVRAQRLRRGRNTAFVQADVESDAGLGLRATFVFMQPRASRIDHATGRAPDFPAPDAGTRTFQGHNDVAFIRNFEILDKRDGIGVAEWLRWTRLIDRAGLDPAVELIAVADMLPPAAWKLLSEPAPVSSMTWLVNLLQPVPATTDGWWLLRAHTDAASGGVSSQAMAIWAADGTPAAQQMQSIALFA